MPELFCLKNWPQGSKSSTRNPKLDIANKLQDRDQVVVRSGVLEPKVQGRNGRGLALIDGHDGGEGEHGSAAKRVVCQEEVLDEVGEVFATSAK